MYRLFPFIFLQTASSSGDPHVHIIKDIKATDEGLYTCIAGNVLGQATASAYLEVNAGPMLRPSHSILLAAVVAASWAAGAGLRPGRLRT